MIYICSCILVFIVRIIIYEFKLNVKNTQIKTSNLQPKVVVITAWFILKLYIKHLRNVYTVDMT